ncbi:amino acid adenylation domain-containing protein [Alteromonas sp. a30]|uniref:amino acid adenylation domain-containing protein n=1 Tax=Alteromonas sp. a30 TaxID=2730917 RepID=UPI0022832D43|nr:amino acid adenylation domain-containing protein [Alteromonas sp. a30]MCY7296472.1 amino acid adenylation domain-containing protein [Alteromonas sp. a30]
MKIDLAHSFIEPMAANQPNVIAVKMKDNQLSYQGLNQRSAEIATQVAQFVKTSETCVGMFIEKSIDAVVAIYGILRSGSVYVPMDIKNPVERLRHIIKQCEIDTLVTTPNNVSKLDEALGERASQTNLIVINDDASLTLIPASSPIPLEKKGFRVENQNLATVLYTSGSTGVPKGVMLTHNCLTRFCDWSVDYFKLTAEDKCISHAPLHFDLSIFDIFAAHRAGATTVLVPDGMSGNPRYLTKLIATESITVWQSVPSVLVLLLKYGAIENYQYPNLRQVLFAGEKLSTENAKKLATHFSNATLHNIYGSTETNNSFVFSFPASLGDDIPDPLPIGKAYSYVDYMIVTLEGEPAGIGEEGELYVKTPTLMRGYRNNKAYLYESDARYGYFKTNDIVKQLPDGNVQFCARADDVLKSNGYRINVTEIDTVLQSHDVIREVGTFAVPDDEIGNRLIAYICADEDTLSMLELKTYCAKHLPHYAVPHEFEITSEPLPKTSSGKVNKQQLKKMRQEKHVEIT